MPAHARPRSGRAAQNTAVDNATGWGIRNLLSRFTFNTVNTARTRAF